MAGAKGQETLLLDLLDDYEAEDDRVRVVDALVNRLDFGKLEFAPMQPTKEGGQPTIQQYCGNPAFMATSTASS